MNANTRTRIDDADWETYKVSVPVGASGDWVVSRFTIHENSPGLAELVAAGRDPGLGTFTALNHSAGPMMNDCRAEILDHYSVIDRLLDPTTETVLISGLGLGMITSAALRQPHVRRVDVIEAELDVIRLVGRPLLDDPRLTIHHADALTVDIDGTWDVVWHDIWPTICPENVPQMSQLRDQYAARARWQGCWAEDLSLEVTRLKKSNHQRLSELLAVPWG